MPPSPLFMRVFEGAKIGLRYFKISRTYFKISQTYFRAPENRGKTQRRNNDKRGSGNLRLARTGNQSFLSIERFALSTAERSSEAR